MLTKKDKHLAAAQKFLERGQPERALEEFSRVVEEDPSDTRTRLKMAEIYAQRGDLPQARDIYLATAEIYLGQGFLDKAATLYKSVLKLMPRQPAVRVRLGDTYRQLGRVADALRELDLAATEFAEAGRPADALPALRRIVGLHPDNVVSRIKLAEMASQSGAKDEAVHELRHAAEQLKHQGRTDEYVRVAERLLHHRPDDFALGRELGRLHRPIRGRRPLPRGIHHHQPQQPRHLEQVRAGGQVQQHGRRAGDAIAARAVLLDPLRPEHQRQHAAA